MKKKSIAASLAALLFASSVLLPCQTDNVSAAGGIRVSKTKVTVIKGEQVTVKAKNTGSRKIKARISNKKIASVKVVKKKIRITGKKQGKTKVTLTASHMKKCVIRVSVVRDDGGEVDTVIPTTTPTRRPSSTPYMQSTASPTAKPTVQPTHTPTASPTVKPTVRPTHTPTATETVIPSVTPGVKETPNPTIVPSIEPTEKPQSSETPSIEPTVLPTATPKASATVKPTTAPTVPPTATPKASATAKPTTAPTVPPTATPKASATAKPTTTPIFTSEPSAAPTTAPITTLATTRLCYGDQSLYIGESLESLKADWGEPDRIDPLPQKNMTGYIYNSNSTTAPYLLVGISDQKVIFYFTVGKGFTAYDATVNTADSTVVEQTKLVQEGAGAASLEDDGWEEPGLYEFDALDSD